VKARVIKGPFKRKGESGQPSASDYTTFSSLLSLCRAAQKLNLSSKKKKHRPSTPSVAEAPLFATSFSGILQTSPPPAPPCLLRAVNKVKDTPGMGKVGASCCLCHLFSGCGSGKVGKEKNNLGLSFSKMRRYQGQKETQESWFGGPSMPTFWDFVHPGSTSD
jgi:hypothetical protein